ncbi:DUF3298 and DUF4163 domain-containing protein [Pontibacter actiniarum]|uniref:DUF3298 domain-containing protein n=1 Tax=Pontibacter actiniarum TaxID=323450 RepID=A0A1X9YRA9_9BACT|nr:DUF3298 and DUF4163 domain-containing protein [Pontibacter actiniarum]ARS35415.1 hypothetical protein CA264_08155 [Pontibacter actiniarum]
MPSKLLRTLALCSLIFSSCQSNTEKQEAEAPVQEQQPLTFRSETVTRQSGLCGQNADGCATAEVKAITAEGGAQSLRDSLNTFMAQQLLQMQMGQDPDQEVQQSGNPAVTLAETFIRDQEEYLADLEGEVPATAAWTLNVAVNPIYQSDRFVTLRQEYSSYTGGAHGNSYFSLQTFDRQGNRVHLTEMVTDTTQLLQLAEREVRRKYDFPEGQSLTEAGLFVEDEKLPLPQEAGLTDKGLLLLYNSYEIGPYSMGMTEVTLPYAQIGNLLKPIYKPEQAK